MGALQVGIIGVSVERGWAKESHVPAVQHLSGLELAAVATNSQQTADAAAKAFGARAAYGDAAKMIADPSLDMIAVCVRVPAHLKLVLAALEAKKHVYCEWPTGRNLDESEQIAKAAKEAGVHAIVGLQTRANPAVLRAQALLQSGALGRVLTARAYSSTVGFGAKTDPAEEYTEDPTNGVTLVTIQGAHTFDLALALLGGVSSLAAQTTTQYPQVHVGGDAQPRQRITADHLLLQARMSGGEALALEIQGGRPPQTPFRFEIVGDKGTLALEGGAARGFQSGRLSLTVNGEPQIVEDGELAGLDDAALNVGGMYALLRDSIHSGVAPQPDFEHAARLNRMMDSLATAATSGTRAQAANWPVS